MIEQIIAANKRLKNTAHLTPVMHSATLNRLLGAEVYFKCENLQRVGAFKFRGAYNAIVQLTSAEKARGVLTYSSGNHAQAVALVGRMLGVKVTVVMPEDAPSVKKQATLDYGARIISYDPISQSREVLAKELESEYGYTVIPPYDHPQVIAGQGTAAYEFCRQIDGLELLLTPCGGGGLLSGCAVATKHLTPGCKVVGVEPELADDATRSFYSKTLHRIDNPRTIADGTRTPCLGQHTFPLILANVDAMVTVTEESIKEAVLFLFSRMKIVVEPSGALGLAALLQKTIAPGAKTGVVLSGGNMDPETLNAILK